MFRKSDSDSDSDDGGRRRRRSRDYPAGDDGEEWVEYTDALGRSRTCMRKDLKKLQRKDSDMKRAESSESSDSEEERGRGGRRDHSPDDDREPDMLSEDMRREMLRQKWEKEELENLEKDQLHYSDVRFDEARNHGAGFYAFSKDDDKRSKEQINLKNLHEETDQARKEREKKADKRKRDMAERIRKIKQKRREKMGLPPLEDEPEPVGEGGDHTRHPGHRDDGVGAGHQEPLETGQRRDQADVPTHDGGGGHVSLAPGPSLALCSLDTGGQ